MYSEFIFKCEIDKLGNRFGEDRRGENERHLNQTALLCSNNTVDLNFD